MFFILQKNYCAFFFRSINVCLCAWEFMFGVYFWHRAQNWVSLWFLALIFVLFLTKLIQLHTHTATNTWMQMEKIKNHTTKFNQSLVRQGSLSSRKGSRKRSKSEKQSTSSWHLDIFVKMCMRISKIVNDEWFLCTE